MIIDLDKDKRKGNFVNKALEEKQSEAKYKKIWFKRFRWSIV